jgi:hypothetical protein
MDAVALFSSFRHPLPQNPVLLRKDRAGIEDQAIILNAGDNWRLGIPESGSDRLCRVNGQRHQTGRQCLARETTATHG